MPSIGSKTFNLRVSKLEQKDSLRKESKSIKFAVFAMLYLLC